MPEPSGSPASAPARANQPPEPWPPRDAGLRVGVTGHRGAPQLAAPLVPAVRRALESLIDSIAAVEAQRNRPFPTVVSSLAEGADTIVAEAGLAARCALLAILPVPPEVYRQDFRSPEALSRFDGLLGKATALVLATDDDSASSKAYEAAGRAMVDASDALVAVWDGRPARGRGGTAEIVAYAESRSRPILLIEPAAPETLCVLHRGGVATLSLPFGPVVPAQLSAALAGRSN